jgi:phospholipase/carboxylesterase
VISKKFIASSTMKNLTPSHLKTDPASGLSYRLIQTTPGVIQRCLVLLHGVGSNELSMVDLASGVADDTLVVLVRGPLTLSPQQFAWFHVSFTSNGPQIVAEQAERSRQALISLLSELQKQYGLTLQQTVVAGFSQGGIMSSSVALTSPESVAGFGLLSGRILPEIAPLVASKDRLSHLRGFVGHGELDGTLPVEWAHRTHTWLNELEVRHTFKLYPIGHSISPHMHSEFLAWLLELN